MKEPWIGVDLDGTLAEYDHWRGEDHIGQPILVMVKRVQRWLEQGERVKVFTARACLSGETDRDRSNLARIREWTRVHVGVELEVTNVKDYGMVELWDDRAVTVQKNTGRKLTRGYGRR